MADVIAAIATPPGEGGIAIVRISGEGSEEILRRITGRKKPYPSHRMLLSRAYDEGASEIDEVMVCFMRAPKSYTREDVGEIYCHGGMASSRRVLARAIELGARAALPGEFTRRAFENGRIDLSRAEAVMQVIGAESESALRVGVRQLEGGASAYAGGIAESLTDIMALIEASTDFPDEIDEAEAARDILPRIEGIISDLEQNADPVSARFTRECASVVLAGRPNVGKSSLMNALLRRDRAIVTSVPGTTRDVLTEKMLLAGITVSLSDTAGQRETEDPVEQIGVDRAGRAMEQCDLTVLVLDGSGSLSPDDEKLMRQAEGKCLVAVNKGDLPRVLPLIPGEIEISAQTGEGIEELRRAMAEALSSQVRSDPALTAERHIECASRAKAALVRGADAIRRGMALDAVTMDVKEALDAMGEITGDNVTEDVIDRVFREFCVGK